VNDLEPHMLILTIDYELKDEDLNFVPFLLSYRLLKSVEEYTEESFKDQELLRSTVIAIKLLPSKAEHSV
jgi:hypothetical protein